MNFKKVTSQQLKAILVKLLASNGEIMFSKSLNGKSEIFIKTRGIQHE